MRADPRISVQTLLKPAEFGAFKFLWKLKLEYDPKAPTTLTQPVLLTNVIGFRGFKAVAFVATASQTIHAIDYDFGTPLWKYHINYTASPPPLVIGTSECPVGMTAAPSRATAVGPTGQGARGGGRGGGSGGGVGAPGKGATTLAIAGQAGPGGTPPGPAGPPPGTSTGVVPGSAAAAAGNQPGGLPGPARAAGGGGGGGGFVPGSDAAYVVGTDGYLHALNIQNGWDNMTPALFLPANTRAVGLIIATTDDSAVAYAATTNRCGSQPDAVWAMDLDSPQKTVTAFKVGDAIIVGSAGPALGRDGTVYIATGSGSTDTSNTIFALTPKTLRLKALAKVADASFTSSPLVFQWKDKEAVIVAGGGKVYLFDSSLRDTPLAVSPSVGTAAHEAGALTSWLDAQGIRWVGVPHARGVTAFRLIEQAGKPAFEQGWVSSITSPLPPLVINGVLLAASAGTRAAPAVLYALDAATGKPLWNSGKTITTTVRGGLAGGQGNVYVPGSDSTLYAFGFDFEK
jgi:hypothetical protein